MGVDAVAEEVRQWYGSDAVAKESAQWHMAEEAPRCFRAIGSRGAVSAREARPAARPSRQPGHGHTRCRGHRRSRGQHRRTQAGLAGVPESGAPGCPLAAPLIDGAVTSAGTREPKAQADARLSPEGPSEGNQGCTGVQLIGALATILAVHCARAAASQGGLPPASVFCAPVGLKPYNDRAEIQEYLLRIRRAVRCSKECLVLALVYMDRAAARHPHLTISGYTVHRLVLASVLLASKFWDDAGLDNAHYADAGGLDLRELNAMEAELLRKVGWRLKVQPQEYEWYHNLVCQAM